VFRENNERIDFRYVRIPYDKVPDAEVTLSDDDYEDFLDENPNLYRQTAETRLLNYVVIDVVPTSADTAAAMEAVAKHVDGLRIAPNDSAFVRMNDGVYDPSYKKKADLPPSIGDTLMRLPLGTVVGPYLDGGVWSIAKILDRKVLADSVRARHILLRDATPQKEKTVDSLLALLNGGRVSFDSLARQNSQDQGSAVKGGDLGYMAEGATVPEFNNILFYTGQKGKVYKVATQFGWHLIEILDQKFIKNETGVKAVYLSQRVEPSKATQQAAKDRAMALFQNAKSLEDLAAQAQAQNLEMQLSAPLKENDFVVGNLGIGEGSRDMVRWAFEKTTDPGDVSKEVFVYRDPAGGYFDSKYVVAGLKGVAAAGKANVATLKALPEAEQKVKNRKRAEILIGKMQNKADLSALAQEFAVTVDTAKGASMMQSVGEPTTLGVAFSLPKGSVSEPVVGNSGVYVVQPLTDKPEIQVPADLTLFKRQANSSTIAFIKRELMPSLMRKAEVQDNRSKFF
jgi:peptidyl-prolyl cis-trans isomerase D